MVEKIKKGSFTVEAACVMPLILLVLFWHDLSELFCP